MIRVGQTRGEAFRGSYRWLAIPIKKPSNEEPNVE
jgi:hypothetical protein